MTESDRSAEAIKGLVALLGGVKPPSRSKVAMQTLIRVLGNILAVLLSLAFVVGLVDIVLLLFNVARKLL